MPQCMVPGCGAKHYGLGLCQPHYYRAKVYGDPLMSAPPRSARPKKPPPLCTIEGCEKRLMCRGLCSMHLARLNRRGDPLAEPLRDMTLRDATKGLDPLAKFIARLTTPRGLFGCWEWHGSTTGPKNYGLFAALKPLTGERLTHRAAYVLARGPIPEELQLDHLCRNPPCCNPWHLEIVTGAENMHRGDGYSGVNFRKTHCNNGHPLSGDNLRIEVYGARRCVACAHAANARWKAKQRA